VVACAAILFLGDELGSGSYPCAGGPVETIASTGAAREIVMVLGLALVGVLLALLTVLTPWYAPPIVADRPAVVEMRQPVGPKPASDFGAARRE